jgi:hypothetical protein
MSEIQKVSVREFRNHISQYMEGSSPFAVTKHGQTVGYYIPAKPQPSETDRLSLQKAASALDAMLAENGVTEEELMQDFRELRKNH